MFIYIDSLEKERTLLKTEFVDIENKTGAVIDKKIKELTTKDNPQPLKQVEFDRYLEYSTENRSKTLKDKVKERRLKLEKFNRFKNSFHLKKKRLQLLNKQILSGRKREKYLIQDNLKFRTTKQKIYLLRQKEKDYRKKMVDKLIQR